MSKGPINKLLLIFCLLFVGQAAFALTWSDLWYTKDQQGARALKAGKANKAARLFKNNLWRGVADYRAGRYKHAEMAFQKNNSPLANYNRGNALAYQGKYPQAIAAYNKALKQDPNFSDAKYNRDLLKKLIKKSPKQQNKNPDKNPAGQDQRKPLEKQTKNDQQQKNKQGNANKQGQQHKQQNHPQANQHNQPGSKGNSEQQQTQQQPLAQQADKQAQPKQQKNNRQQPNKNNKAAQANKKFNQQAQQQQLKQQALQQWLQQIPDDPGGLLKQKFLRDHRRLKQEHTRGT